MKQKLELIMKRISFNMDHTIGKLSYAGFDESENVLELVPFLCNTLEPAAAYIKENRKDIYLAVLLDAIFIKEGTYKVRLTESPKLERETPELEGVKGHTDIRIHAGNSVRDTSGCILVGLNDSAGCLSHSRQYESIIVNLIKTYKECIISISLAK